MPNVTPYVKTTWVNLPTKMSPINDTNLNHIETAIYDLVQFVNTLTNTLAGLTDTTINNPANGHFLKYNGSKWVNAAVTIVSTLADLTDTTISNPTDGQILKYNGSKWINAAVDFVTSLANLSDTEITTPTDGQILKYDGSSSKWVNAANAGSSTSLSALTDTNLSSPTDNQVLKYDSSSSKWVNGTNEAEAVIDIGSNTTTRLGHWGSISSGKDLYLKNYRQDFTDSIIVPYTISIGTLGEIKDIISYSVIYEDSLGQMYQLNDPGYQNTFSGNVSNNGGQFELEIGALPNIGDQTTPSTVNISIIYAGDV